MMTEITSIATVATDRAGRYGKQLASHLGRRSVTHWDADTERGTLDMGDGAAHAELVGEPDALVITLTTSADNVGLYEDVVGRHLVRFGQRDELVVAWTRSDGTEGTTQVKPDDE